MKKKTFREKYYSVDEMLDIIKEIKEKEDKAKKKTTKKKVK